MMFWRLDFKCTEKSRLAYKLKTQNSEIKSRKNKGKGEQKKVDIGMN